MQRDSVVVKSMAELPPIPKQIETLYLDVETVSFDDRRGALKPYQGDRVCGIAFTFDECRTAWYLPVNHRQGDESLFAGSPNLPHGQAMTYVAQLLGDRATTWVNHNVKFDAHFLTCEGVDIRAKMVDTRTLAKVVDMQRNERGYGLKPLARVWLGLGTDEQDEVKQELRNLKTKDFGAVDSEILGKYACADVHLNRALWQAILRQRYDGIDRIWSIENDLTNTLFQIERRGLNVDLEMVEQERKAVETEIAHVEDQVVSMGYDVDLNSPTALVRFCIETLGLPVVAETEKGRPSVNSAAVASYRELAQTLPDARVGVFLGLLDLHRELSQYHALYLIGWQEWIDERGMMRPMYEQTVRTGRMSCRSPNMQQLSKRAKKLIVPAPGNSFLSRDYSQMEYRVIASICREPRILTAYQEDAATDFHTFVAQLCGIDRKPAKTINFGIAFGMGASKLVRSLAGILGSHTAEAESKRILDTYHETFPTIRATSKLAEQRAKSRGWIRTLYGRRRALDEGFYFKAFNTAVQGTAADIVKERLNDLERDGLLRQEGVTIRAVVHDEVLLEGPTAIVESAEFQQYVDDLLTSVTVDLGVPFSVSGGTSSVSWADV